MHNCKMVAGEDKKNQPTIHPTHLVIGCRVKSDIKQQKRKKSSYYRFILQWSSTNQQTYTYYYFAYMFYILQKLSRESYKIFIRICTQYPIVWLWKFNIYKICFTCFRNIANSPIAIENKAMSCKLNQMGIILN